MRERRKPRMPNEIGPQLEQRIIAFSLAHPGFGPRRISAELAREKWGGIRISEHGVWRVLVRVGLNTRGRRLALVARHRDPYERAPSPPPPERHIDASVPGRSCRPTASSSVACRAARGRSGNTRRSMSRPATPGRSCTRASATLAHATARRSSTRSRTSSPRPAGSCRPSRPITAQSSSPASSGQRSKRPAPANAASKPDASRQTAGVERVQLTILEECWRPSFARSLVPKLTALRRDLDEYLTYLQHRQGTHRTTHPRTHPSRHRLRCAQDGSRTMTTCRVYPGVSAHNPRPRPAAAIRPPCRDPRLCAPAWGELCDCALPSGRKPPLSRA